MAVAVAPALAGVESLLLVGRAACPPSLGDLTNRSTKEGLALSFGRRPSILSAVCLDLQWRRWRAPATNPGFECRGSRPSSYQLGRAVR